MARHRGAYKPETTEPYELSRSKIEAFKKCPACFWLEKSAGIKFPSIPGFLLNTNTDTLLKKDFDPYRGLTSHPTMAAAGLEHLRPFSHQDLDKWAQSIHFGASERHFNSLHEESNILFGGGLDDVWENMQSGELHIVDYKSTAQMGKSPKPLDESFIAPPQDTKKPDYKAGYRRQMDMYQWILRRKGFRVSDIGYFLYVDGQHLNESGMLELDRPFNANMKFNVAIIPYKGDDCWVEDALIDAKACLTLSTCPDHSEECEFGSFINLVNMALE